MDFAKEIQPILEKSCLSCHGPEKQKAKLRLDTRAAALKGGEDGVVLVPGHADKSELYRRITLPETDDDVMPSKGDLLTKAQTDRIRDWINQGAVWPDRLVIGGRAATKAATETSAAPEPPAPAEFKPAASELKAVAALDALGIAANPIAANLNWRGVNLRAQPSDVLAKVFPPLKQVLGLVELNLGATKVNDADLANLAGLTNLTRLHLENTPITDAGLLHLRGLTRLEYLNLYGTAITDAGLKELEGLKRLKHLYLWQTKTTASGVQALKQALPQVDISTGVNLEALAKPPAKADAPKANQPDATPKQPPK